jgi:hypothetical protein
MEHEFTREIERLLADGLGEASSDVYAQSPLLQYLNIKTKSAARGSKARGSFANLYAIYVLVEDYQRGQFNQRGDYANYKGARFTELLRRQRELPFGRKLQNHALNSRVNAEFKKYFPQVTAVPILRDLETNRYWINENLLRVQTGGRSYNIAATVIAIIDQYIAVKQDALRQFIETCQRLMQISSEETGAADAFINSLLSPHVDARIFEITSYAILKFYYHDQIIYLGYDRANIHPENLKLYKTGRTNANDGGIDFVMRPLGRIFQVTETLDVRKYFLDIDKIERYPICFVIKSEEPLADLERRIREGAVKQYAVTAIVEKYMGCIEEIINLPILRQRLREATEQGYLADILAELVQQSRVEFDYEERETP